MIGIDWLEWGKFGWAVAQTLITAAIGLHLYLVDRQRIRRDTLDALEGRLNKRIDATHTGHEARLDAHHDRLGSLETSHASRPPATECAQRLAQLTRLEQRIEALPTSQMVRDGDARAHQRIDEQMGRVANMEGALRRIEGTLDMISTHLLNRGQP